MQSNIHIVKRTFDIAISSLAIILLILPMLLVALIIALKLGMPIIFKQDRIGLNNRKFTMYKFRSMSEKKDSEGRILPDSERICLFGKILRSTSIDELPELWNVFKGDMSIVGPRPLLVKYLERYSEFENRRHEVRPGITGWAQVNGRNNISWDEKFKLDVWYVDNMNFLLDILIILKTIKAVFIRKGISACGYSTMPEFKGYHSDEK